MEKMRIEVGHGQSTSSHRRKRIGNTKDQPQKDDPSASFLEDRPWSVSLEEEV